jgi:hypothetical protein
VIQVGAEGVEAVVAELFRIARAGKCPEDGWWQLVHGEGRSVRVTHATLKCLLRSTLGEKLLVEHVRKQAKI